MGANIVIDEASPVTTYQALEASDDAVLIDVRTRMEWDRVGVPDVSATKRPLWFVEWVTWPDQAPNPAFLEEVLDHAGGTLPRRMFFICRSGVRSAVAARVVAAFAERMGMDAHCTNVIEGFEGSPAFGPHSGWKALGLPFGGNGEDWKRS